ncbi:MAG: SPFH domain-containing protein [Planctomycetota bacterium]|jgi:regulator of protease activity HflC (stomatin/prohibitin superfamily)
MPSDRFSRGPRDYDGRRRGPVDLATLKKILGNSLTWVALAFRVVVIFLFMTFRMGEVSGEQVGVLLNNINGEMTMIEQAGVTIYNGITSEFYVLDKRLKTLKMPGDKGEKILKVKTVDGSDVDIHLKVQYRVKPGMAVKVITTSGPGDAFKEKWARDYTRAICRNYLGELTTEECYDSAKREEKVRQAEAEVKKRVSPFGIEIDSIVIPQKPTFYKEYEDKIKEKKLADQEVLKLKSKAVEAETRQAKLIVDATNVKNVAVREYGGEMEKKKVQAKAEAKRAMLEADAYHTRITIAAEAALYEMQQTAEGILATKRAEAKGIEEMKKALEGEGGRNMVKLEYAKKLKNVTITGQPFIVEGRTERFQHLGAPASAGAVRRKK